MRRPQGVSLSCGQAKACERREPKRAAGWESMVKMRWRKHGFPSPRRCAPRPGMTKGSVLLRRQRHFPAQFGDVQAGQVLHHPCQPRLDRRET